MDIDKLKKEIEEQIRKQLFSTLRDIFLKNGGQFKLPSKKESE